MEKGFYHAATGYWQTTDEPSQVILDGYPEGTVEVPLKPGSDYDWDGSQWVPPPAPTPEEILHEQMRALEAAVQAHIDATARARGYRHGDSAALHALDPRPEWAAEGAAFTAWRSAVWSFVYDWLARVQAGNAAPPEDAAALVAALPPIAWIAAP